MKCRICFVFIIVQIIGVCKGSWSKYARYAGGGQRSNAGYAARDQGGYAGYGAGGHGRRAGYAAGGQGDYAAYGPVVQGGYPGYGASGQGGYGGYAAGGHGRHDGYSDGERNECALPKHPPFARMFCTKRPQIQYCTAEAIPHHKFRDTEGNIMSLECINGQWSPQSEFPEVIPEGSCKLKLTASGKYFCKIDSDERRFLCKINCSGKNYGWYSCDKDGRWTPLPPCVKPLGPYEEDETDQSGHVSSKDFFHYGNQWGQSHDISNKVINDDLIVWGQESEKDYGEVGNGHGHGHGGGGHGHGHVMAV